MGGWNPTLNVIEIMTMAHCDYDHGIVEQRIEVAKHN